MNVSINDWMLDSFLILTIDGEEAFILAKAA
jgi:hypothetical protein